MLGQVAFEYLALFSIVLVILSFLTYYAQDMTEMNREEIASSNAIIAVNKIVDAADIVFTQGSPSQITLSVYIPENVNSVKSSNNVLIMKIRSGSSISDVFAISKANLNVSISNSSGTKRIKVKCCEGIYVNITES